jgi:SAM-dependent methyltransferase
MTDFDARARSWDQDPSKLERARRVADVIRGEVALDRSMSVFEYGCGTGLLGFELQPHVARVTLADASREMLAVLREKIAAAGAGNMTPLELDLLTAPLPADRYDLVCTLLTLHHIPDTGIVLGKFRALLAPGGRVCISDLDREDGSFHGPGFGGHHGFDRAALGGQLERAGFRNVRFTTACEIVKQTGAGPRGYPVFLAVADAA